MKSLLVMLLMFGSSTMALAQCSEADKKALEAFDHAWTAANSRGDRATLESIYADDYTRTSLTGPANKAEIIDATLKSAARDRANPQSAAKVTADHFIITCTQNTATITHRSVITTSEGGRERTAYSRSIHFLEKRGGRWQVVSIANHPLDDSLQLLFMEDEWNEAVRNKDVAWFERNLADDFTFVNYQTGAVQAKDSWLANLNNRKTRIEAVEASDLKTRVNGDLGFLTGLVEVKGRDEQGQTINYSLRFTTTYVRRDGRWQALAAHATRVQS